MPDPMVPTPGIADIAIVMPAANDPLWDRLTGALANVAPEPHQRALWRTASADDDVIGAASKTYHGHASSAPSLATGDANRANSLVQAVDSSIRTVTTRTSKATDRE